MDPGRGTSDKFHRGTHQPTTARHVQSGGRHSERNAHFVFDQYVSVQIDVGSAAQLRGRCKEIAAAHLARRAGPEHH